MKLYTLRHKKTGEFMPCRPCSQATGFTLWTPGDKTRRAVDANPRIFYTLCSARMAKAAWVRGLHIIDRGGEDDPDTWVRIQKPKTPRHKDELQILMLHTSDWFVYPPLTDQQLIHQAVNKVRLF